MEESEFQQRLQGIISSAQLHAQDLHWLHQLVRSQEVRDLPFGPQLYEASLRLLRLCWPDAPHDEAAQAWFIVKTLPSFPEFDLQAAVRFYTPEFLDELMSRFDGQGAEEADYARNLLHWIYKHHIQARPGIRKNIGEALLRFCRFPSRKIEIGKVLEVLGQIVRGSESPVSPAIRVLFRQAILPLHLPNEFAEWRDQLPLLQLYHGALVFVTCEIIEKERRLATEAILYLLQHWPEGFGANTPKEVLFIHEVEKLLHFIDNEAFSEVLDPLFVRIVRCIEHDNSVPIERVLQLWKNTHFNQLCANYPRNIIHRCLRPLLRGGKPFWNPTVNKMTALVLEKLKEMDSEAFAVEAEAVWGGDFAGASTERAEEPRPPAKRHASPNTDRATSPSSMAPPTSIPKRMPQRNPTAVRPLMRDFASGSSGGNPPVTITGVAPWAMQQQRSVQASFPMRAHSREQKEAMVEAAQEPAGIAEPQPQTGIERVLQYIARLKPPTHDEGPSWHDLHIAPSPTLLPSLKFHDLVFGQSLGSGAFSTVKYARRIMKDKTRSQWPEYAVKIISTEKMRALGYEQSVIREIAALQLLAHPGIARMVSSFRWRDGAYLVLEYASKGDLHTYIVNNGSLDEESCRFVVGEILAALVTVHDLGFVYGDLKPENIVITERDHIKLTDFGACRPFTQEAIELLEGSRNAITSLRNGDWKEQTVDESLAVQPINNGDSSHATDETLNDEEAHDNRVEGTPAYLPPEVLSGGTPNVLTDAWSLGCTIYFCLFGRPPLFGEQEEVVQQMVRFSSANSHSFFGENDSDNTSAEAKELIQALLAVEAEQRLSAKAAVGDKFFTAHGVNVTALHFGPAVPLAKGAVGPQPDAEWARRQFSKIWSPMPQEFNFQSTVGSLDAISETRFEQDAGFFPTSAAPIPQKAPLAGLAER